MWHWRCSIMYFFQPTIEVWLYSVCFCLFFLFDFIHAARPESFLAKRDSGWALERMVHLFTQTLSQESEGKLILHFKVCFLVLQVSDRYPALWTSCCCWCCIVHNIKFNGTNIPDEMLYICMRYIFHTSNGERANRQCLERRGPLTKNSEDDLIRSDYY